MTRRATAATSGIVGIEHDPAVGLGDAADRRLDLGQLGQGVDPLQVEVVGRHVGQHARIVRLVADAAQDDPAARRLEDRDVDVAAGEDLVRAAGTGPVARLDHPLVDQDPVRGGRPDVATGAQQDVGDQPGDRALAVGPRDRHDRDAAIGVAEPLGRRRTRRRDPFGPAGEQPFLGAGQPGGPRRRHVALGEGERRLGEGQRALGTDPREGHDPVTRVGRAMDGQATAALAVVGAQAADPGRGRGHPIGPVAGRHRGAEMDERVTTRVALAVPGPPSADGDLELDHRLEPVDVRAFKEAGLDQTHGPGRIARCQPLDWVDDRLDRDASDPVGRRARRPAHGGRCRHPGLPGRPGPPRQHRLRELHAGRGRRGRALGGGVPRPIWAPRSSIGRIPTAAWATRCSPHSTAGRTARASC